MRFIRRPKKKYGPIHGRGRAAPFVPDWAKARNAREDKPVETCVVPAGTRCHVRKLGAKAWRAHRTKREVICKGFLWRNETHYGLQHAGYEVKVKIADMRRY